MFAQKGRIPQPALADVSATLVIYTQSLSGLVSCKYGSTWWDREVLWLNAP